MSDEDRRALERAYAQDPSEENEERLSLARCRAGEHEWSPWTQIVWEQGAWARERVIIQGRLLALEDTESAVFNRQCFWCFKKDHLRRRGPCSVSMDDPGGERPAAEPESVALRINLRGLNGAFAEREETFVPGIDWVTVCELGGSHERVEGHAEAGGVCELRAIGDVATYTGGTSTLVSQLFGPDHWAIVLGPCHNPRVQIRAVDVDTRTGPTAGTRDD